MKVEKQEFSPAKWGRENLLIPSTHSPFRAARFSNLNTPVVNRQMDEEVGMRPRMLTFGEQKKEEDSLLDMYQ